jgi:MSHA biogenesis protein MshK
MAGRLNPRTAARWWRGANASAIIFAGVCAGAAPACAQGIADPTRPPASLLSPQAGDAGGPALPVLHSIKITATERIAIIGGETVRQGGKFGDARVIRITENEVVLRSAAGTETLRLYPDVDIKPVVNEPAVSKKPGIKKRAPAPTSQGKTG